MRRKTRKQTANWLFSLAASLAALAKLLQVGLEYLQ